MRSERVICVICVVALFRLVVLAGTQSGAPEPAAVSLPETIPIFPLDDVMLFPNSHRPLHIFEPRYRAMVADALEGNRIIGMVLLVPGFEADYTGRPPVYPVGCAGVITNVEPLPDGRYNIVLRGLVKFRIRDEDQSRVYRLARVEAMPETADEEERAALGGQRDRLESLLISIAPGLGPLPEDLADEDLIDGLSQYLDIHPAERQDLLEREGSLSRAEALIELLEMKTGPR